MPKKQNSNPDSQAFIRAARRQIVRSAIFAAAAMGVIVFACYAWFAGNSSVTGTIGSIQMLGSLYELAGEGTTQDDPGYGAFYDSAKTGFTFNTLLKGNISENGTGKYLEATGGQQAIRWRLNDKSKIGNYGDGSSSGIHPGSEGTLQFYVIPKVTGTLKLKFQLDLNPLDNNGIAMDKTADENKTLCNLLKGHLVFSLAANGNNNTSWLSWDGNTFEWQFDVKDDSSVGVPQLVTLNWKWPEDAAALVSDNALKSKIAKNGNLLFYAPSADETVPDEAAIQTAINNSQLDTLTKFYNRADRYIGSNLTWLEVKLSADLASNSTNN